MYESEMDKLIRTIKFAIGFLFVLWLGAVLWNIVVFFTPLRLFFKPRWPTGIWSYVQGVFFYAMALPFFLLFISLFMPECAHWSSGGPDDLFKVSLGMMLIIPFSLIFMLKTERLLCYHGI